MMCLRLGLRAAWRHRRLVLLVWVLFLAVALLAAAPAWRWWNATLSLAPEGDRLLDGLNAALLRELSHEDRSPTYAIAFAPLSAFVLAMLVLNPFVAGGLLSVLSPPSEPSEPSQSSGPSDGVTFFAGGVRRYWLFLRLLLLAGVLGAVLAALFLFTLMPILSYVGSKNWEQLYLFVGALLPVALAVAFGFTSLLLDVARVRAVRTNQRRAWRALGGSLRFVWRNTGATLAVGIAFALLTALAFAVYFAVSSSVTPKSWIAILLVIVWQQTLSLVRTGLRVAMLAAEVELVAAREPLPIVTAPIESGPIASAPIESGPIEPPSPELPMTL
jgi:hypothetical protein